MYTFKFISVIANFDITIYGIKLLFVQILSAMYVKKVITEFIIQLTIGRTSH